MPHKPVFLKETIEALALSPGAVVLDGTLGRAGHALEILKKIGPEGMLIGLDQDPDAIRECRDILKDYPQARIYQVNFAEVSEVLENLNVSGLDAVILDVGTSLNQLEDPARGFSFDRPGPLDMRMNPADEVTAADLVNRLDEKELISIFQTYGEERFARRFAAAIVRARKTEPIETTEALVAIVESALPKWMSAKKGQRPEHARRHPATRVFQALRITVNAELKRLQSALPVLWERLNPGGRIAVIAFHSLEDRIVKHYFRSLKQEGRAELITKKPVMADEAEQRDNPRSRSAKLRVARKR